MAITQVTEGAFLTFEESLPLLYVGIYAPYATFPESQTSGYKTSSNLEVPAGAVVDRAVVQVVAAAPISALISEIATVRNASGDPADDSAQMVIDFGVMRNVSGLQGPATISTVVPWLGTAFGGPSTEQEGGSTSVPLQEIQTERLLVTYEQAVSVAAVGACTVLTTTPPADLELLVAGTRAWFRQGPVPAGFSEDVDITAAVQAAVTAGASPVPVVLKTRVPGYLELSPVGDVSYLSTHIVQFDQGATTTVDAVAEGIVDVALPLPPGAEGWTIHRVVGNVVAEDRGPERIDPPVGPAPLSAAELTLDPDRRLVVRLPADAATRFATLSAVRVRLQPGAGGIGVVGGLLDGTAVAPGVPVPGGEVVEVAVEPSAAAEWVTLRFAREVALPFDGPLWLSLAATRGRAVLGLRDVTADADFATDGEVGRESEIALIRRIAPNGVARALSAPVGLRTDALALRLVGTAPDGRPIDLVDITLAETSPDGAATALASTAEISDGPTRFVRALLEPSPVSGVFVRATVSAATRLTVGPVVIAYEEHQGGVA